MSNQSPASGLEKSLCPRSLCVRVIGDPKTQGSMKGFVVRSAKTGNLRAVVTHDNAKMLPWRDKLIKAFMVAMPPDYYPGQEIKAKYRPSDPRHVPASKIPANAMFRDAVHVTLTIILPRLAKHPKTEKGNPVGYPTGKNDLDKHIRAVGDALTLAGVILDDGLICSWSARKRYAKLGEDSGARIGVFLMDECSLEDREHD
jgi:Endodeoxyribonuclease RusA